MRYKSFPDMTKQMEKALLRREFLAKRIKLSKTAIQARRRAVEKHLFDFIHQHTFHHVFGYMAYGSEVPTVPLLKKLRRFAHIYVPKVNARRKQLEFYEVANFSRRFRKSPYGIMEPSSAGKDKYFPGFESVILVPGVVFDKSGRRLGYGKGYYDRLLKKVSSGVATIGVCYGSFLIPELPWERHDKRVRFVATEKGILKTAKRA